MTELQLYKFINENNIEYHWGEKQGIPDVIVFIDFDCIMEFTRMIPFLLDEGGINVILKETYICVWMLDICERSDIDIKNIFPKP
jgi:hypothetical protein